MDRLQKTLVLLMVAAVPVAAPAVYHAAAPQCFRAGSVTYRLSSTADAPDFRVKIDNAAAHPDMRVQLVDDATAADFVLVDDVGTAQTGDCRHAVNLKTIEVGATSRTPDVTVSLSHRPARSAYKVYVNSVRFSHRDAAALLAAMTRSSRTFAARN